MAQLQDQAAAPAEIHTGLERARRCLVVNETFAQLVIPSSAEACEFMLSGECGVRLEQGRIQAVNGLHTASDQAPTLGGQIGKRAGSLKLALGLSGLVKT